MSACASPIEAIPPPPVSPLLLTELLINAIKYAFPVTRTDALIKVRYEISGADWQLTVADNGIGKLLDEPIKPGGGLGTAIVKALVRQLEAQVETTSTPKGTSVAISRASFQPRVPVAA